MIVLQRGTDHVVTLPGLRQNVTPVVYLNAATVRATLYLPLRVVVPWLRSALMTYVTDSDGTYTLAVEGQLLLNLPPSTLYKLEVKAVEGSQHFRTVVDVNVQD
jgi:hypothetical protein